VTPASSDLLGSGRQYRDHALLQGGEEAAALLSQLDATEGGEMEMNWNIKVRGPDQPSS
jgi:hypothetical protein